MIPQDFPQKTKILERPLEMTEEECAPLAIYQEPDKGYCLSCWRVTWRERLSILFFGRVWLWVINGPSQPPVALAGVRSVFQKTHDS